MRNGGGGEKKKKNTYSVQSAPQWGTEEGGGARTPAAAPGLRPNTAPLRPVTSPSMGFSLPVLPHPLSRAELPDQGEGHIKGLARPPDVRRHDPFHGGFLEDQPSALGGLRLRIRMSVQPPKPRSVLPSAGLAPFHRQRKSGTVLYTEIPGLGSR